jgi:hypothetical protein
MARLLIDEEDDTLSVPDRDSAVDVSMGDEPTTKVNGVTHAT